jgi:hypothetical protein
MRLMASCRWTATTAEDLAAQWDCHISTVRRDAGEASRRIHEGIALDQDMRDLILLGIQQCASDADKIVAMCGASNPGTAVKATSVKLDALKALAGIAGCEAPRKVDVTMANTSFDGWTREEKEAFASTGELPSRFASRG